MGYSAEINKAYLKDRYDRQRAEFIAYLGGVCVRCGSVEDLEFDHIERESKSFTIARLWPVKDLPRVYEELDLCQLLCRPCHIEKTADESRGVERGWRHGTVYSFMKKRCDCDVCAAFKREWSDARNASRRATDGPRGPYVKNPEHGTVRRYYRGCRCDECRAARTEKARREREAKRMEREAA